MAATRSKKKTQKVYLNSEKVTANHVSKWTSTCVAFSMEGCVLADNMDAFIAHVQQINIDGFAVILTTLAVVRSRRYAFEEGLGVTPIRPQGSYGSTLAEVLCLWFQDGATHREAWQLVNVGGVERWGRRVL